MALKDLPTTARQPPTTLPSRGLWSRTLGEEGNAGTEGEGASLLTFRGCLFSHPLGSGRM